MGNFDISYDITIQYEGDYDFDVDDVGGETYRGIARRFHPDWAGWSIIDKEKALHTNLKDFVDALNKNMNLQSLVRLVYRQKYWNAIDGEHITNQELANALFDIAVNMGVSRAILFLQKGLNVLNKNATLWSDLVEDGEIGPKTINTLSKIKPKDYTILIKIIMVLRGCHYIDYMRKSPIQEKYARGWFERVVIKS